MGRLGEPRKGFPLLAEAFGVVAADRPGLRLLVVGGGDVDEARELLPGAVRDQVTFLGPASDEDKAAALRTADVYVAPNTGGESFGIVLAEAMAAGATVLASDIPAFRRVLDEGDNGVLFANEDPRDLARAAGSAARRPGTTGGPGRRRPARRTPLRLVVGGGADPAGLRDRRRRGAARDRPGGWCSRWPSSSCVGLWLTWTANRLDRMHHRIDVARGTLDAQLLRRSGATLELASSEALDPPSRLVLLDAAHQARNAGPEEFESAESALSQALRAVLRRPRRRAACGRTRPSRRSSTSWPATAPASSWPAGSTTTWSSRPGRCARAAGCAGCAWRDTPPSCAPSTWTTYPRPASRDG